MSGPAPDDLLSVSELAARLGITQRAVRFYQQQGLISWVRIGRAWFFDVAQQQRAGKVIQLRRLGFTITEIRKLLKAEDSAAGRQMIKRAVEKQISILENRRQEIEAALEELRDLDEDPDCPSE